MTVQGCVKHDYFTSDAFSDDIRSADGYAKWHKRFLALNWDLLEAESRFQWDHTEEALALYEMAANRCLVHGYRAYWVYEREKNPQYPNHMALVTVTLLSPYLNKMANHLLKVADEYAKQGNKTKAVEIAAGLIRRYPDIIPRSVKAHALELLSKLDDSTRTNPTSN